MKNNLLKLVGLVVVLFLIAIIGWFYYKKTNVPVVDKQQSQTQTEGNNARDILPGSALPEVGYPVKDYLSTIQVSTGATIFRLDIDLNNDGYKEVLVSNTRATNGKAGTIWEVYINDRDKGYYNLRATDSTSFISFNSNAFGYATMFEESSKSLITYVPDSATSGVLVWYRIENDKIIVKHLRIVPQGKDSALYEKLITNQPKVEQIPI